MKPEARPKVLEFLRKGHFRKDACALAGISFSTFREWYNRDPEFSEAVKEAESASIDALRERIELASYDPKHWTAAAWLLERRNPKEYGKRERVDVKQVPAEKLTDEQLAAELEKALGALRKGAV